MKVPSRKGRHFFRVSLLLDYIAFGEVLSLRGESTQRRAKEGDFDFPLFGNSP